MDNSGKAIGWLNRSKLSSSEAERDYVVALLKIQRRWDPTLAFAVSGRVDGENVGVRCKLIDAEPTSAVVVLDLMI